jgi:hypothetical protein
MTAENPALPEGASLFDLDVDELTGASRELT